MKLPTPSVSSSPPLCSSHLVPQARSQGFGLSFIAFVAFLVGGGCESSPERQEQLVANESCVTSETPCGPGQVCSEDGICLTKGAGGGTAAGGTGTGSTSAGGSVAVGGKSSGGGSGSSTGGRSSGGTSAGGSASGGGANLPCTNDEPPPPSEWPEATCEKWANETGECGNEWMLEGDYCNESCGRCEPGGDGDGDGGDGDGDGGSMGQGTTYTPLNGEQVTHSTRYWDCCKPSCGWTNAGNIHSCSASNGTQDIGVNDMDRSVCDGGSAQTCHGMAPWVDSSTDVAYGYVAANGRPCGACYQMQFTGEGNSGNDAGSQAIAGKTMIVMVTNRGAELGDGHFDILIPGGGLGMFDGCSRALNINAGDMGETYGGIITTCRGEVGCIRNMCSSAFSGFPDLEAGCLWSADWFAAADNPKFQYKEIACPPELSGFN